MAEVYLAQAKIGAVTAALNPYWPVETLRAVVERSGCTAFVYDSTVEGVVARDQAVAARHHHLDQGGRFGHF